MSKRKTILASKRGGISEIIEDGSSGILVDINDKKLWKKKIIQILKGNLDTGPCAYDSVQAVCSFEVLYPKYMNLYESILLKGK
jgi:glycosyltransferase involved in cell wall biosynthesis